MAEEGVVGSPLGKSRTLDLSVRAVCFEKTLLSGFASIPSGPRCKETTVSMGQAKAKPISAESWGALAAFFQEDGFFCFDQSINVVIFSDPHGQSDV